MPHSTDETNIPRRRNHIFDMSQSSLLEPSPQRLLSPSDFEYHIAACLCDSIRWMHGQIASTSPSHPIPEPSAASLPTHFPELHRRVQLAYIRRRAAERAAATGGQTEQLRVMAARRRREALRQERLCRARFVWSGALQQLFEEAGQAMGWRAGPYSMLVEMRKRGAKQHGLTTAVVRGKLRQCLKERRRCWNGVEKLKVLKRKTRAEKIREMLPEMCREKPTAHLGDEWMYFDAELRI